jgi:hypothetical protein
MERKTSKNKAKIQKLSEGIHGNAFLVGLEQICLLLQYHSLHHAIGEYMIVAG